MTKNELEKLLWSIALPGFGQMLNKKYVKGITFIILEFLINTKGNFNESILLSFQGHIHSAFEHVNMHWLMFYPCLYFFSMWDAVKDSTERHKDYAFLPYVSSAYFVTVGLMYSTEIRLFGFLMGPIFLPILFVIPGVLVGLIVKQILVILTK